MRVAALFSGGKDSVYAARLAEQRGHTVTTLVSLRSLNPDSYMFHTVNQHLTALQAEAWGKPLHVVETRGEKEEELTDLEAALSTLEVDGAVTGAIASNYQRERVDAICMRLGIKHLSPLWGRERVGLVNEMLDAGMEIVFSAVAAHGLDESWLGETLTHARLDRLKMLSDRYGVDPCGEGGEYESLVLATPWWSSRLVVEEAESTWDGSAGRYQVHRASLQNR